MTTATTASLNSRFELARALYARHNSPGQRSLFGDEPKPPREKQRDLFGGDDDSKPKSEKPDTHWITIHSHEEGGKGVHVEVDSKGNITKGPAALADKGIHSLADFGKAKADEQPAKAKKKPHEMTRAEWHKQESAADENYDVSASNKAYWKGIREAAEAGEEIPAETRQQFKVIFGQELPERAEGVEQEAPQPEFVPHPVASDDPDAFETVHADVQKLDAAWSGDKAGYVGPDGTNEIEGRRDQFREFQETGEPIQQPHVVMRDDGQLAFNDGRHRTRELIEQGHEKIPLTVPKEDADAVREQVGADELSSRFGLSANDAEDEAQALADGQTTMEEIEKRSKLGSSDGLADRFEAAKQNAEKKRGQPTANPGFKRWLNRFIDEKGIDREEMLSVEGYGGLHQMPVEVVLEHMLIAPKSEQDAIKNMIVKIDFRNGDVVDYFRHLATAIAGEPDQSADEQPHPDSPIANVGREPGDDPIEDEVQETSGNLPEVQETSEEFAESAASPHVELANRLADKLKNGEQLTAKELFRIADEVHGGTRAQNKYGHSEATDSLEAAVNIAMANETDPSQDIDGAREDVRKLDEFISRLPTQTNRDGNKDLFQQFSTPPHYSYAAAWAANIKPGDVVLEPSAGTGCLSTQAVNAGATVYANEIDPRRAELLRSQLGEGRVSVEDAEQISAILPGEGVPQADVVLMNPPFSHSGHRLGDKKDLETAGRHIAEAGRMLKPGGRLVSVVGGKMDKTSPRYAPFFRKMAEDGYDLRASVLVNGDVYKKYGTSFDSRLLVFDKREPTGEPAVTGEVNSVEELLEKLEGVRHDRETGLSGDGSGPESSGDALGGEVDGPQSVDDIAAGTDSGVHAGDGGLPGPGTATVDDAAAVPGAVAAADRDGTGVGGVGPKRSRGKRGVAGPDRPATVGSPSGQDAKPGDGSGKAAGGQRGTGGRFPAISENTRAPERLQLSPVVDAPDSAEAARDAASTADDEQPASASIFSAWKPQGGVFAGAKPHPSPLVESSAMAGVRPPKLNYSPTLSPDVLDGKISDAQLENIAYAGQAHSQQLEPDEKGVQYRRGFFIGDGTGSAKGRQIAGCIADNFNQGRKRAVWLSKTKTLLEDARRDFADIGLDPSKMIDFDKFKKLGGLPDGHTLFLPYTTLKSGPRDKTLANNLQAITASLGADFDGVIAFDEAHLMGNAIARKGKRGGTEPSQQALAGIELQHALPDARVLYSSATGATEISNLSYADRLGLWGRGTEFNSKSDFINKMEGGGIASMEAIAHSMKATGSYASRSLAMSDGTPEGSVEHERMEIGLTNEQKAKYDKMADAWSVILNNINEAIKDTGGGSNARKNAMGAFLGAEQRFFNQVITSMATPSVIESIKKDLAEGRAPVIGVVNTGESATKRAKSRQEDGETIEDMDVSPREVLMQFLENAFPVHRYEEYVDENGNTQTRLVERPVKDEYGKPVTGADGKPVMAPVEDPEAVKRRNKMLDFVGSLRDVVPESPLDQIINHFGHEMVAEATGRTQRRILMNKPDGKRGYVMDKRNPDAANEAEARAFQNGDKKILIFSDAGGTGRSYHASRKAKNQGRRVHYMLQPGWRADAAMQALGRTHRTNQSSAPIYRLPEMADIRAQKRFISTIARRLDQLGSLSKGERRTGGGGMFGSADNLESRQAQSALDKFFHRLKMSQLPGLNYHEVMGQMGLKEDDGEKKGRNKAASNDEVPMTQFLNRMLALKIDQQQKVFDAFDQIHQQVLVDAEEAGELDHGMEDYRAHSVTPLSDNVVFTDPVSGAETRHVVARVKTTTNRRKFPGNSGGVIGYFRNGRSGQVWAAYDGGSGYNKENRRVEDFAILRGPGGTTQKRPKYQLHYGGMNRLDMEDAERAWEEEYRNAPEFAESDEHFVTGALLPVWGKLPKDKPRVFRIRLGNKTIVGRHIPEEHVNPMLDAMGASGKVSYTPAETHRRVSAGKHQATLANGWRLTPKMVQGERRIEITGPSYDDYDSQLEADGVRSERIQFNTRYFVPTGEEGVKVLERIAKHRPISEVSEIKENYSRFAAAAALVRYGRHHAAPAAGQREFWKDEPRDDQGRWTDGATGGDGATLDGREPLDQGALFDHYEFTKGRGQQSLFGGDIAERTERAKAATGVQPSKLEKIEDEIKQRQRDNKPLKGQGELLDDKAIKKLTAKIEKQEAKIEELYQQKVKRGGEGRTRGAGAGGFNRDIQRIDDKIVSAKDELAELKKMLEELAPQSDTETDDMTEDYSRRFALAQANVSRYGHDKPTKGQRALFRSTDSMFSDSEEGHWITLHSSNGESSGTRVKIDSTGNIVAGPAALAEKGIRNLSDFHKDKSPRRGPWSAPRDEPRRPAWMAPQKDQPESPQKKTPTENKLAEKYRDILDSESRELRGENPKAKSFQSFVGHGKRRHVEGNEEQVGEILDRSDGPWLVVESEKPYFISDDDIEDQDAWSSFPEGAGWYASFTAVPVQPSSHEASRKSYDQRRVKAHKDAEQFVIAFEGIEGDEAARPKDQKPRAVIASSWQSNSTAAGGSNGSISVYGDDVYYYHPGHYDDYRSVQRKNRDPELAQKIVDAAKALKAVNKDAKSETAFLGIKSTFPTTVSVSGSDVETVETEAEPVEPKPDKPKVKPPAKKETKAPAAKKETAPAQSPSAPSRGNATATFTKLKDGSWGLRVTGSAKAGDSVTVTKKDGSKSTKKISRIVWSGNGAHIAEMYERDRAEAERYHRDSDHSARFALARANAFRYSRDASGHEHKGKGPGGGQFTGTGGGGGGSAPQSGNAGETAKADAETQKAGSKNLHRAAAAAHRAALSGSGGNEMSKWSQHAKSLVDTFHANQITFGEAGDSFRREFAELEPEKRKAVAQHLKKIGAIGQSPKDLIGTEMLNRVREHVNLRKSEHEYGGRAAGRNPVSFTDSDWYRSLASHSESTRQPQQSPQQQPQATHQASPATAQAIDQLDTADDPTTAPPPGKAYRPDPAQGKAARVGVPGDAVPPPPSKIPRLPNLNPEERAVENEFATMFEQNPDGMADQAIQAMANGMGDGPNIFATDEMKGLFSKWKGTKVATPDGKSDLSPETKEFRSRYNTALHQTANAIAKRAFVRYLDTVVAKQPPEQRNILVTAGGVAAGKGYAIANVGSVNQIAQTASATWDSAGEQNSTELPWLAEQCKSRGIKMTAVFVHADPMQRWENPGAGVVERAGKKGRMVDARVFADSYTHGAKNFADFHTKYGNDPHIHSVILDNRGKVPQQLSQVPQEALAMDPEQLYSHCIKTLATAPVPQAVKDGGSAGVRIWGQPRT